MTGNSRDGTEVGTWSGSSDTATVAQWHPPRDRQHPFLPTDSGVPTEYLRSNVYASPISLLTPCFHYDNPIYSPCPLDKYQVGSAAAWVVCLNIS